MKQIICFNIVEKSNYNSSFAPEYTVEIVTLQGTISLYSTEILGPGLYLFFFNFFGSTSRVTSLLCSSNVLARFRFLPTDGLFSLPGFDFEIAFFLRICLASFLSFLAAASFSFFAICVLIWVFRIKDFLLFKGDPFGRLYCSLIFCLTGFVFSPSWSKKLCVAFFFFFFFPSSPSNCLTIFFT